MSSLGLFPIALDVLGLGVSIPDERQAVETVLARERERVEDQLSRLSPGFRERLTGAIGIDRIACFGAESSELAARRAARAALEHARIAPERIGLVLDFTTLAVDAPQIGSLAHAIQGDLGVAGALAFGVHGSGCAGLHAALLSASCMLAADETIEAALLVAADRAPEEGRSCLPVSIMADAASALVVARAGLHTRALGRIRSVAVQHNGRFSRVLVAEGQPSRIEIDSVTFERKVLPMHFVMLYRVLTQALGQAERTQSEIEGVVYPNTTALDRLGLVRGFGFPESILIGPGPRDIGHAFANDMLINAQSLFGSPSTGRRTTAWLATGSGFTWAAAIVEVGG